MQIVCNKIIVISNANTDLKSSFYVQNIWNEMPILKKICYIKIFAKICKIPKHLLYTAIYLEWQTDI